MNTFIRFPLRTCLPISEELQTEFASSRNVVDPCTPNEVLEKVASNNGLFKTNEEGEKAILSTPWKLFIWANLVMSVSKLGQILKKSPQESSASQGLENIQANEAADTPKNVDRHNFVKFNSESDQETCSEASRTISLSIGPTTRLSRYEDLHSMFIENLPSNIYLRNYKLNLHFS
ncbi:LOW QUALITY PROTEIN: hypothetical protein Cgig2_014659 [Carnegiea gigantea]|uniref:Uncharacterized protein n=1 Tax=Carnegiea gigantea TaxID=171969 RepID=A0A9Q1QTE9_9CARY|nr:LOW QUALITY PROTEIN: hypothetical protein Cgig2_014659 [Carnegiea gigantea]